MQAYSTTDLAWAAGFIDGEGCFHIQRSIRRGKRPVFMASLSVAQVSEVPLLKLQEMLGGNHYLQHKAGHPNSKWANCWQWRAHSATALRATTLILPYLVLKREQAEVIIELGKGMSPDHIWGRKGLPEEEVQRRDALIERLSFLNRRGPRD